MARTKLNLPSEFSFSTTVCVRIDDINYAGHLSNDRVLSLMHEARVRYLGQFGFTELDVDGVGTIMTDALVLYKNESFHGETLEIKITAGEFRKYGCELFYRLSNPLTGKEIARAKTGLAFFDYEKRKMADIPSVFIDCCASKHQPETGPGDASS